LLITGFIEFVANHNPHAINQKRKKPHIIHYKHYNEHVTLIITLDNDSYYFIFKKKLKTHVKKVMLHGMMHTLHMKKTLFS